MNKIKTHVTIDPELRKKAKEQGINISELVNKELQRVLNNENKLDEIKIQIEKAKQNIATLRKIIEAHKPLIALTRERIELEGFERGHMKAINDFINSKFLKVETKRKKNL